MSDYNHSAAAFYAGRFPGLSLSQIISALLVVLILCSPAYAVSWDEFKDIKFIIGDLRYPFIYNNKILGKEVDPFSEFGHANKRDFFWAEGDMLYAKKGNSSSSIGTGIYVISQRYTQPLNISDVIVQNPLPLSRHP